MVGLMALTGAAQAQPLSRSEARAYEAAAARQLTPEQAATRSAQLQAVYAHNRIFLADINTSDAERLDQFLAFSAAADPRFTADELRQRMAQLTGYDVDELAQTFMHGSTFCWFSGHDGLTSETMRDVPGVCAASPMGITATAIDYPSVHKLSYLPRHYLHMSHFLSDDIQSMGYGHEAYHALRRVRALMESDPKPFRDILPNDGLEQTLEGGQHNDEGAADVFWLETLYQMAAPGARTGVVEMARDLSAQRFLIYDGMTPDENGEAILARHYTARVIDAWAQQAEGRDHHAMPRMTDLDLGKIERDSTALAENTLRDVSVNEADLDGYAAYLFAAQAVDAFASRADRDAFFIQHGESRRAVQDRITKARTDPEMQPSLLRLQTAVDRLSRINSVLRPDRAQQMAGFARLEGTLRADPRPRMGVAVQVGGNVLD